MSLYKCFALPFNDYFGCLTITTAHNTETTVKRTKPRRRIAPQRGSLMCKTAEKPYFKRFSGIEKVHRNSIKITVDLWRRDGDSNPRSRFNGLHDFQSCSFDQLGHLSIEYCIFRTPDYYIQIIVECQGKNAKFHKKLTRK